MARNGSQRSGDSKATRRTRTQGRLRRAFFSLLDSGAQALESLHGGGRAPAYAPSRVRKSRLMTESLEPRQMLASDFYVNDNWVIVTDQGAQGLDNGDTVDNSADIGATPVTGTFGTDAFDTITGALGPAIDGDTVHVLQGTYNEHVAIAEGVTLVGAQAGVDARTRGVVPESIVDGTLTGAPFAISADGVVLDGFTITGGQNGGNAGITIATTSSGYDIKNNIITGNTIGIYANSDGAATIRRNRFDANNLTGASGGAGIYSEATQGLVVDNNTFTNHTINNPVIFAATALGAHQDLMVSNNVLNNEFGIFALALDGATFANNEITTNAATALTIADGSTVVEIRNNDLSGNLRGVRIADFGFFGSSPISNVTILENDLSGNTEAGLLVTAGSFTGTVDASANWWGSATAAGVTAAITSNGASVDYTPWLNSGTDTSAATGFQGDFSSLTVDDDSPQADSTGRIREGIDFVNVGGVVIVLDGTYEENLTIDKSLDLVGPNATLAGSDPGRGAEATILASAASDAMIDVTASGVEITGFTIDGGGQVIRAIRVNEVNDVVARNNIITGAERGIQYNGAGGTGGHNTGGVVQGNLFDGLVLTGIWGTETYGVVAFDSSYVSVTDNVMTGLDVGVFEQYFYQPNGALNAANEISGNDITAALLGYGTNERAAQAATTELSDNTFTLVGGTGSVGVQLFNIYKADGITLVDNTITGADVGVYAFISGGSVSITGGSIDGNGGSIGVQLTNYLEAFASAATGDGALSISGVDISDIDTGVLIEDDPLGAFGVHAVVTGDTDISATDTGILVRGADASALVSGNDDSINGNGVGIDVDGGTAAMSDNHIYNNAIGIRVGHGGTASIDNNEFDGGTSPDNTIDVQILSDAGPVVIGLNNHFAGNTFFIDNQSTQSFALSSNGTTFDETNNFRREDKMHHRMDTDLPLTTGLVTWVADSLFVTAPGVGSTDSSIQRAIDAASPGDTIFVEAGTYTENLTIGKDINLVGAVDGTGAALVNLQPAAAGDLITINGSAFGDDETVSIANFNFDGVAGLADRGIHVASTADFGTLSVDNASFTGFDFNAVIVNGPATGSLLDNVEISNATFTNNGIAGGGGSGDLQFFLYNGDATLSDLVLVGSSVGTTGPRLGIQFRGTGDAAGVGTQPMGNVTLDNVDVSGDYVNQMIGIQRYSDVSNLSLNDLKLGGATSSITGTFGASLRLDAVGAGTLASPATVDLGNTHFRGLDPASAIPFEIEIAPDNTHTFLRADATGTTWTVGGVDVAASALTLSQAFDVEDRILHYVDGLFHAMGAAKGFVEVQDGKAFVSDTHGGSIRRGVEAVDANGTVHVSAGTFTESVLVDKTVTLLGAQAGVDARGRVASESIITPAVGDEALALVNVTAPNVTIDGFTIDGDGPAPGGVLLLDGITESNAARGIVVDADNAQVLNNRVMNTYRRGVQFWVNAASAPIGGLVNRNELSVIGADVPSPANSGDAILAFSDPTVTNNKVVTARTGITFIQVYAPNVTPISISGNEIDAINGIALNETSSSLPAITMSGNTVTTNDGGVGLLLWSVGGALNATGNTFTGTGNGDIGVYGWTGTSTVPMNVALTGGSITNYETGLHLTNDEATFGPALADTTVTLDGVSISGGDTGVLVEDAGTSAFAVNLGLTGNTAITGTVTGIVLDGASAALLGDTLGDTQFTGQSGDYIRLANGAYGAPGAQTDVIDATAVTFNGLLASAMTSAQRVALEGKIFHEPDDATLGFVRVDAVNDNPVATDDSATVAEDSTNNAIDVLANDEDVDADTLTIAGVTQGANGAVTFTATGVSYTPNADFFGSDSFTYTIGDGKGGTDTATVNVTVTPVNDNPVAMDDSASVNEDSTNNLIDVLANDTDGVDSGETLTVTAVTQGANGTVTFTATGVSYTPNADFFGSDSFTYTISDGNGGTDTATVNVTVIQVGPSFTGTNGNDVYLVRLDATGMTIEVYNSETASGTPIFTTPLAGASELTFDTLAGDDRLIIDLTNGNPIPANDISLIAGANGGAGDKLEIRGAGTGTGSFAANATDAGAGLVTLGGREIDLAGVEAIDAASLDSFAVVMPNAVDTISVDILSDGSNVLSGTSGGISLPTVTLGDLNKIVIDAATNDAGGGDDSLSVDSSSTASDLPFIEFNSGTGTNTLTVDGETSRIDATMSSGGSLATVVSEDATLVTHRFRQTSLTLSEGSRAIVLPDGTSTGASVLEILDIGSSPSGPTAQLDLTDNDLILRATAATSDALHAAIEANIKSARNGQDSNLVTNWNGQGITSSTARTSNLSTGFDLVGLGVIRNSDLEIATGLPHSPYTTFAGQPVGPDDVLIKFTYTGDGNFDGQVDFDDYIAMDNAFNGLIPNLGWATGDINYDEVINFDDYSLVDQAFFFQSAPLSGGGAAKIAAVDMESGFETVAAASISSLAAALDASAMSAPGNVSFDAGLAPQENDTVALRKPPPSSATPLVESNDQAMIDDALEVVALAVADSALGKRKPCASDDIWADESIDW